MRRGQYFSGNYGSALGSTANAANLIARAGEVQGQMYANLGKIAAESINKYTENKQKKEEQKQAASFIENYLINNPGMAGQFGIKGSDLVSFEEAVKQGASAIAKNPKGMETVKGLLTMEQERVKAQEASKVRALQMAQIRQNMDRQNNADQLAGQERNKAQTQAQSLNRFLQTGGSELLQTDQGQGLYNRMVKSGVDPSNALKKVQAFEQRIAQSQPKAPTINEQIALEKRAEEVEEKTQLKESEEQQRQSLLAETNDILGIIESGKDVTGQVEGLDFVRALKKSVGYGKEDEKLRRKLERYANKFTLENVSKLKGPLSEKELAFIQQSSPKITDEPEVWVDFLTGLKDQLNTEGASKVPQVDPSTPASQSILDEIERKKQLRSKRTGL
ncbi:MAG: hypothetical protein ACO23H_16880 [Alphaproteobacteria bacterium]